jgi:hypothetical protein
MAGHLILDDSGSDFVGCGFGKCKWIEKFKYFEIFKVYTGNK